MVNCGKLYLYFTLLYFTSLYFEILSDLPLSNESLEILTNYNPF